MAKVKEVWVRFNSTEEFFENEEKLYKLLDKAPGNCIVKAYIESIRAYKNLHDYSFNKEQLSLLMDVFGEGNVKCQEKEIRWHKPKEIPKIKQILPCNHDMYAVMTDSDGMEYKCKVLMYALCDDGEIYPLYFDSWLGISPLSEAAFDVELYEMENGVIDSSEGGKQE